MSRIITKGGVVIEFKQNIDNFEWLLSLVWAEKGKKKELVVVLTDEDMKWLILDLVKRTKALKS